MQLTSGPSLSPIFLAPKFGSKFPPKLFPQKEIVSTTGRSTKSLSIANFLRRTFIVSLLGLAAKSLNGAKAEDGKGQIETFAAVSQTRDTNHNLNPDTYVNLFTLGGEQAVKKHINTIPQDNGGQYTSALLKLWKKPGRSLGQAHHLLEGIGYSDKTSGKKEHPVSGNELNMCLNTWKQDKDPHKKFALLLTGPTKPWDPKDMQLRPYSQEIDVVRMENMIKEKVPLIPDANIVTQRDCTRKQLYRNVQYVADEIRKKNIKDPEILLYYTGHAISLEKLTGRNLHSPSQEGAHTGLLQLKMDKTDTDQPPNLNFFPVYESWLQQMLQQTLPTAKITIVLDACNSGAFTKVDRPKF